MVVCDPSPRKHSMLVNGVSVERTDLAPTPGLTMHDVGDKGPALWRLYARAPYVVQNGLACDIVLWASQPPPEGTSDEARGASAGPSPSPSGVGVGPMVTSPGGTKSRRRITLASMG